MKDLVEAVRETPCEKNENGFKLCQQLKLIKILIKILESETACGLGEGELVKFLIQGLYSYEN